MYLHFCAYVPAFNVGVDVEVDNCVEGGRQRHADMLKQTRGI